MTQCRATCRVPANPVAPAPKVVEMASGLDQHVGYVWRRKPGLGEQILAIDQQFWCGLDGLTTRSPAPMCSSPACSVKTRRSETINLQAGIKRHQHAFFRKFIDPRQVNCDNVRLFETSRHPPC